MSTGSGQDRKTIVISTGDNSLASDYACFLQEDYDISVFTSLQETLEQISKKQPSLLILDPRLVPDEMTDTVSSLIRNNPVMRLIVVENTDDQNIDQHALFKAGAHGFCKHDISAALLGKAVHLVLAGEYWIKRKLITRVISELARDADTIISRPDGPDDSLISTLTPRELQVARMVHMGGNNKIIARKLEISERTVKAHLSAIFRKLDIENRLHLALFFSGRI